MGQREILQVLKNSNSWLGSEKIAKEVGITRNSARRCLFRLKTNNFILCEKRRIPQTIVNTYDGRKQNQKLFAFYYKYKG